MQNMYKDVVLDLCPQAASTQAWYNFYNIPALIRIYDTGVKITNLYGSISESGTQLDTCAMGYDSTATKYFTVAQAIAKRASGLLDIACYRDETGGYVQYVPGILDPAHVIPDIQIPEVQVPTMVPKVDVQVQADSAMAAPLAYYAEALGAGATAIDMSMNQVCEQLELRPRLSSYTDTSCTYTILGTDSARTLPISLYGVRYVGQGKSRYATMKKIQTIPGSTKTGQNRQFTVNEGETASIYIYYKIICTPDETGNTYSAQLQLDTSIPQQQFGETLSVNKLIATVTMSRSKAQDSTNVLQSPEVGGLSLSSSTTSFGYQLDDGNDRWLAQAFEQWNAVVNQKLTFSGRCSASITYHVCGQLIVYQSQFGYSTQATPKQLKQFAIPAINKDKVITIAAQITPEGSAQEQTATNSLLTVKTEGDKAILCDLKPTSDKTCQILNYNSGVLTLTPVSATAQGSFTILSCGNTGLTVIQAPLADAQGESIILGANNSSMISIALPKESTTPGYALAWTGSEFINSAVVGGPTDPGYHVALGGQTTGGDTGSVVTWSKVGVLPADKEKGMYWVESSGKDNEAYTLIKVTVPSDAPGAGHFLQVTQSDSLIQFKYVDAAIPTTGDNQYLRWVGSKFDKGKVQIPVTTDPGQFLTWSDGKFGKSEAPPTVGAGEALTWTGTAWSTVSLTGVDAPTGDGYYMASPAGGLDNIGWTWVKAALVPAQATQKACLISIGADGKAELTEIGIPSGSGLYFVSVGTTEGTAEGKLEWQLTGLVINEPTPENKALWWDGTAFSAVDILKPPQDLNLDPTCQALTYIPPTPDPQGTGGQSPGRWDTINVPPIPIGPNTGTGGEDTDTGGADTGTGGTDTGTTINVLDWDDTAGGALGGNWIRRDITIPKPTQLPTTPTDGKIYVLGCVGGALTWLQTAPGQAPTWPN